MGLSIHLYHMQLDELVYIYVRVFVPTTISLNT